MIRVRIRFRVRLRVLVRVWFRFRILEDIFVQFSLGLVLYIDCW